MLSLYGSTIDLMSCREHTLPSLSYIHSQVFLVMIQFEVELLQVWIQEEQGVSTLTSELHECLVIWENIFLSFLQVELIQTLIGWDCSGRNPSWSVWSHTKDWPKALQCYCSPGWRRRGPVVCGPGSKSFGGYKSLYNSMSSHSWIVALAPPMAAGLLN